jgi:hypothetical protein
VPLAQRVALLSGYQHFIQTKFSLYPPTDPDMTEDVIHWPCGRCGHLNRHLKLVCFK